MTWLKKKLIDEKKHKDSVNWFWSKTYQTLNFGEKPELKDCCEIFTRYTQSIKTGSIGLPAIKQMREKIQPNYKTDRPDKPPKFKM